jgi:tetratricopeptide (TPR) repeat protein
MIRLLTFVAALFLVATSAAAQSARILVVPFENTQREPRLHWLSEASAILLADALNARGLGAITRVERVRAFEQLHLPASASLSRATVIKVGQMVGASEVILGSFVVAPDHTLSVAVQRVRIDVGRAQPDVSERAPLPELFGVFDRVAGRLSPDARPPAAGSRDGLPPLDAFENYVKGLIAENPATRAGFLETALRQHPRYDRALLALWEVRTDQADHAAALAAARGVTAESSLHRRARFLAAVSLLELSRFDESFTEFKALLETAPVMPADSGVKPGAALLNNLGIVQIRRGGTPQTGTATYYLTKSADADPGDPDFLFNLGYAYVLEKNHQAAIYWLRESLRRNPADADAHYILAAALHGAGSSVEAARELELARQLSAHYAAERTTTPDKLTVPKGLERIRTEMDAPRALRPEQTIVNSAQREQRDLAAFHLDRGQRLFEREEDREALAELRRAIYLLPYEARAHLLIGRIHLRGGRSNEAVEALKISIWSQETVPARIALGEAYLKLGNKASARTELERALSLEPESAEAKKLLADIR